MNHRRGSVLIGLLWCLALLSIVVIGVLHTSRIDLMVVKNYGDRIQAHYLAVAGIEKAKALLYQEARERTRTATHHSGQLYDAPNQFRAVAFSRGQFQVLRRGRPDEGGRIIYGVSDEESRLNANQATAEQFAKLEQMTPDIAAAIIDWRDEDNAVTPGGAEAEYYTSLTPPYLPRNGPIQTIRELLLVRGMSRELLAGDDSHLNGGLEGADAGEEDSMGGVTAGWADQLTVDSSVSDITASGTERVNVQTADENSLTAVRGITSDIAKAIVAYRAQNRLNSVADLLDVTAVQNQNQGDPNTAGIPGNPPPGPPPAAGGNPAGPVSNPSGPRVITPELLMDIADELTAQSGSDLPGIINVNTASREVLLCLPGIERELAQAIISFRQSNGFFPNTAWLLKVPGMTTALFKSIAPLVGVRSETFRILSEGKINSTGVRQRIQEIVHIGLHDIKTVSYREDDL